jgi:hypothetical protein
MKLVTLKLDNFQGVKALEVSLDGRNAAIYGDNATGKTTVYNAYTWLLFDKASTGAANFTPKTRGLDGQGLHYLDHSVEGIFSTDGGARITYKKVYHETYTKKRGSLTEEFTGHTTDYYIDSVPCSATEYARSIEENFGNSEIVKLLTMPDYFASQIGWEERRARLLSICGNVSDQDVIAANKELADLAEYLLKPGTKDQYYSVDDYKRIASNNKAEIKRLIDSIPARIDEATKAIPPIPEGVDVELKPALIVERERLQNEKRNAISGDSALKARTAAIAAISSEEQAERLDYEKKARREQDVIYEKATRANQAKQRALDNIETLKIKIHGCENLIDVKTKRREALRADYVRIASETWNPSAAICPTCKRELPDEEVNALRESFNLKKSERLKAINTEGKGLSFDISSQEESLKNLRADLDKAQADYIKEAENIGELGFGSYVPWENTERGKEFEKRIQDATSAATATDQELKELAKHFDDEINALSWKIYAIEEYESSLKVKATQEERIKALEKEERKLSNDYNNIERGLYLCEVFTMTKVGMLDSKINDHFQNVRFQLFQKQINGGIKECCEVLVPTKDGAYALYNVDANNAAKINAGLEIINVLSWYYGKFIPLFVDNAESVTELLKIEAQVIRLVVSEQDKKLRMEVM